MHMLIKARAGLTGIAVPIFGLNAPEVRGTLLVSGRHYLDGDTQHEGQTCVVAILPFAPATGTIQNDQTIVPSGGVDDIAIIQTVLYPEGGFCFDGFNLQDAAYLYYDGTGDLDIDVSFVTTVTSVRDTA